MTVEDEFQAIIGATAIEEAAGLLNRWVEIAREWKASEEAAGRRPNQVDLTRKLLAEPTARGPIIVVLAAFIWRDL